jgi:predicted  nucleic acid-binding Zn-ribbon protein
MPSILLPEEAELARLEAEQADLEEQVASAELALSTAKAETGRFQQRYYATVGRLYARLDQLNAQLAEIRAKRNPSNDAMVDRARSAREQARRSSEEAGLVQERPKPPPNIGPDLKQAYRQAVKLMHPDLALSERERQRRTKLMAELNLAYERGDLKAIKRLADEFGQDPEAVVGEDVGSRIVKAIRRIAQLRRRLDDLRAETAAHQQGEAFQLRQTIETAEANGDDPLGDLAWQLTKEIAAREAELNIVQQVAPTL